MIFSPFSLPISIICCIFAFKQNQKGIKTMNIEHFIDRIEKTDGLSQTLGMHFISTPEPNTLQATMKVDESQAGRHSGNLRSTVPNGYNPLYGLVAVDSM